MFTYAFSQFIGIGVHHSRVLLTTLCGSLLQEDALHLLFWGEISSVTKGPPCSVPPRSTPIHNNQTNWRRAFDTNPRHRHDHASSIVDCWLEFKLAATDGRDDGHCEAHRFVVLLRFHGCVMCKPTKTPFEKPFFCVLCAPACRKAYVFKAF